MWKVSPVRIHYSISGWLVDPEQHDLRQFKISVCSNLEYTFILKNNTLMKHRLHIQGTHPDNQSSLSTSY